MVRLFDNGLNLEEIKKMEKDLLKTVDMEQLCAICLDDLNIEQVNAFPCLNHVAHY